MNVNKYFLAISILAGIGILSLSAGAQENGGSGVNDILRVAVVKIDAKTGVEQNTADLLLDTITARIRRINGLEVVSQSEINAMLDVEKQKQLLGCEETSCIAEIGGAFGVDHLVVGSVGKLGKLYALTLKLINISNASTEKESYQRFAAGEGEELFTACDNAVVELFGSRAKSADIGSDSASQITTSGKGTSPVLTWGLIGGGAAAFAFSAFSFFKASDYQNQYDDYAETGSSQTKLDDIGSKGDKWALATYISLGVGAVAFGTGLYFLLSSNSSGSGGDVAEIFPHILPTPTFIVDSDEELIPAISLRGAF